MPVTHVGEVGAMSRFLVALSTILLLSVLTGSNALAGTQWCVVDPQIVVNGQASDVEVAFDKTHVSALSAPVLFRFHVPGNATAMVSMPTSAVRYTVQVLYDLPNESRKSATTVGVDTLVTSTNTFATRTIARVTATVVVTVTGTSNVPTSITYLVSK
jgi:hypothetical protein